MRKRGNDKKVARSRFINIAEHHKQLIIVIISIIAIIVLSLFMFSKETTVGKAGELYLAGDCVKYCQFEVLMVGSPASSNRVFQTALVPIGEEITTWLNEIPVKIKVYGVNEESGPPSCNFSITPSIEGSTEVVDNLNNYLDFEFSSELTLKQGETLNYDSSSWNYYNSQTNLDFSVVKLTSIGCDSCLDTDASNGNNIFPDFSAFGVFGVVINDGSKVSAYSFQGTSAFDILGKHDDTCTSGTTLSEATCGPDGLVVYVENECPQDYNCVTGVCVQCVEEVRPDYYGVGIEVKEYQLNSKINLSQELSDVALILGDLNNFCNADDKLVQYSCSGGIVKIEEVGCTGECISNYGYGLCYNGGCTDSDGESIATKGEVKGLKVTSNYQGYNEVVSNEVDACLDEKVVEKYCDGNYIKESVKECPDRQICVEGACAERPASLEVSDAEDDKRQVHVQALKDIEFPFYVVMTLFDENNSILAKLERKYFGLEKYNSISPYISINLDDYDLIRRKEVIAYDTPDPSTWNVYLNATYIVEYNESE